MTRKFSCNYSLSVVPFFAALIVSVAPATLAQTTITDHQLLSSSVAFGQQPSGAKVKGSPARLSPGAINTSRASAMRFHESKTATPEDGYPLQFAPVVFYDVSETDQSWVTMGDVNGDGYPDLAVAISGWPGAAALLLGNGDGTFRKWKTFGSGGLWPTSTAIGDVNGDGKPDLVVANWCGSYDRRWEDCNPGTVGVLLGHGGGWFHKAVTYEAGFWFANAVVIADVNGDGHPDIVEANDSDVDVFLGNGDGTFQEALTYGPGGRVLAVGDLNGDGHLDLAVTWGTVDVLLGNGDGTFQPAVAYSSGGGQAYGVAIGDLNGDGKPDLVVGNDRSGVVGVLLGNGDGTLQPAVAYDWGGYATLSVAISDVNGDGKPDIVAADVSGVVGVLLGNGDGTFEPAVTYSAGTVLSMAVGDVDGDGRPDVVVETGWQVGVLLNNSGFNTPTATTLTSSTNPVVIDKRVTYTATVTAGGGEGATGRIAFQDGGTTIATAQLSNNQATFSTRYNKGGVHTITAAYSGDWNNAISTSAPLTEYVESFKSKTVLTSSGSPSQIGQPVTFMATVTSTHGTIPDGELLTFYDGKTVLGSVALANEQAAYTTSTLSVGKHYIKAAYPGDNTFEASSGKVQQVVQK